MRIHYILHAPFEQPGIIREWAKGQNFSESFSSPYAGEPLPDQDEFDTLIIMGGPQSVIDLDNYPYLKAEIALVESVMRENRKHVMGICLGAQIMGRATGAAAEMSPHREIGLYPISLTESGRSDPLFIGIAEKFPAIHWHGDMAGLSEGAQVLASSVGCPRQVIRYGDKWVGFQCHLEVQRENMDAMIANCSEDLEKEGVFVQSADILREIDFDAVNQTMIQILNNWLSEAVLKPRSNHLCD